MVFRLLCDFYAHIVFVSLNFVMILVIIVFFFKQKTAYEMRISDWSSDVCSSDLELGEHDAGDIDGAGELPRLHEAVLPRRRVEHEQIGRASCRERVCQYV